MKTFAKYLPIAARLFLGLIFTVMGLNGFLHFLPMPPPAGRAGAFFGGLYGTGYLLPLLFGTQVVVGVLLLTKRFVPLALTLIAPVVVNIVAFHLFLESAGLGTALAVLAAELVLAWSHRAAFALLLQPTAAGATTTPASLRVDAQPLPNVA